MDNRHFYGKWKIQIAIIFFAISNLFSLPQDTKKIYEAVFITDKSPQIDGVLSDEVWRLAPWENEFIQREPYEGQQPSEKTAFKILYDEKNLYVAIRAYDSQPDKIVPRVAKRDRGNESDRVGIYIDSYYDLRTAFEFSVNAAGVRRDGIVTEDGKNRDYSLNPVWFVKTSIDDSGWVAEMRIPFNQLRFAKKKSQVWGLQLYRYIYRLNEESYWKFIPRDAPGFVHLFGELRNINLANTPKRIELLPYTVGGVNRFQPEKGNPFRDGQNFISNLGLDAKIGVTSDLTLDMTIKPDFGQVEADPSVVNLTAFETFFEEKRPFFIEGRNIMDYRFGMGMGADNREQLFYSRRIGGKPHYQPSVGENTYLSMDVNTDIISAAKLTGKTASGVSVGVLEAITAREIATIDSAGRRTQMEVEPLTNYFVGRLQKDYDGGNTILGGMVTAVNRRITKDYLQFLPTAAYAAGLDFTRRWRNKTYRFQLKLTMSHVRGNRKAIYRLQRSSARYFQRPDANYVTLDTNKTQLTGNAGFISFGKEGTGHWRFRIGGFWRSSEFEVNDLGYLRQADLIRQFNRLEYVEWNPRGIFRNYRIFSHLWQKWNSAGEKLMTNANIFFTAQFMNNWKIRIGVNRDSRELNLRELRGGPALYKPPVWNLMFNLDTDSRKAIAFSVGGFNRWRDDRTSRTHRLSAGINWRPSNALFLRINPQYTYTREDLQYIKTLSWNDEDRYIMGDLTQNTLGIEFRMNYSLTPDLSIELYAQPFISTGKYREFKKITAPRADKYSDRFRIFSPREIRYDSDLGEYLIDDNRDGITDYSFSNPDFKVWEFNSNLVLRWEYHPGSTLYLVWSQSRTDRGSDGRFNINGDFSDLFRVYPDNVFLLKVNHWFSL